MSSKTNQREPLETLKTYSAFQVLRARAEDHQEQFRPNETAKLRQQGQLDRVLDQRTQSAWNALADARANGASLYAAEEVALPMILLPAEKRSPIDVRVKGPALPDTH